MFMAQNRYANLATTILSLNFELRRDGISDLFGRSSQFVLKSRAEASDQEALAVSSRDGSALALAALSIRCDGTNLKRRWSRIIRKNDQIQKRAVTGGRQ